MEEVMAEAKRRGVITTLDVFAATAADLPKVERLLPYTDYFIPSEEEAQALSGLDGNRDLAQFLLDRGAGCVVLTLGRERGVLFSPRWIGVSLAVLPDRGQVYLWLR